MNDIARARAFFEEVNLTTGEIDFITEHHVFRRLILKDDEIEHYQRLSDLMSQGFTIVTSRDMSNGYKSFHVIILCKLNDTIYQHKW